MGNNNFAILYDFDRTLSPRDMQEYGFINNLGLSAEEFWNMTNEISEKNNMDRILSYMYLMIKYSKKKDLPVTRSSFMELGKSVLLCNGVEDWFDRINEYGKNLGLNVEHYILSSGVKEIVEGTPIAKYFKQIYACEFHYNEKKNADWPLQAVNFTTKTQFIFRISKGVLNVMDDYNLNARMDDEDRYVPYRNMIYIGDGITDVPCMSIVKERGGHSIAVYQDKDSKTAKKLLTDDRINFICSADYSKGKDIDKAVKLILDEAHLNNKILELKKNQAHKLKL